MIRTVGIDEPYVTVELKPICRYFLLSVYNNYKDGSGYGSFAFKHPYSNFPSQVQISNILKELVPDIQQFSILNIYEFKDEFDYNSYKSEL